MVKTFYGDTQGRELPKDQFYAIMIAQGGGSNYYGQPWTDVEIIVKRNHHLIHQEVLRIPQPAPGAMAFVEKKLRSIPL